MLQFFMPKKQTSTSKLDLFEFSPNFRKMLNDHVLRSNSPSGRVTAAVIFGTRALCACWVKRAGQRSKATVNCNLSHDKELFIRGLNWLGRREDWREKFGGVGGVSCQSQGAGPRLMIVFKSKHIPQCTSPCLSYAHTDGQRKAVLMLLQTE